jgi:hypothetical protein
MVVTKSHLSARPVSSFLWPLRLSLSRYKDELISTRLESMEGKRMAIDSSIWLYQFQATMRDKDGRVLVNAHVLGKSTRGTV